jgi:hypothetical protein
MEEIGAKQGNQSFVVWGISIACMQEMNTSHGYWLIASPIGVVSDDCRLSLGGSPLRNNLL